MINKQEKYEKQDLRKKTEKKDQARHRIEKWQNIKEQRKNMTVPESKSNRKTMS